ncbi:MAG TPA: adenylate/guanylate cyclase domain-containing protein, partial [Gaiellaceae bacterium]|nr:adenylate/guanylate cyclase domain-containing protein [Gaiellaceae bacterium]
MVRKTVTLVFCDVTDSTPLGERLDAEALRGVWSRYHETAREVLERHGGTIEKFVGDAVLAVFGIPVVHEDDALRAVRAAAELRDALARLNDELEPAFGVRVGVRTGVNTGEVFAGDPSQGDPFATGDAVVVAQRLEATAAPGEILVGDATMRLVRDAVTAEPLPGLALKGKTELVDAWRLLAVDPDASGVARRLDSSLVGRTAELERLRAELERATAERACRIVTIVGEPGVGKSRLAVELTAGTGAL